MTTINVTDSNISNLSSSLCSNNNPFTYGELFDYLALCVHKTQREEMEKIVLQHMNQNRKQARISTSVLIPILSMYIIMILFGACGSILVVLVVLRKKQMQNPRNLFILNVAVTDFILCIFTQPFNLIRLLSQHKEWVYGETLCKMVSFFTGTNMFVSTMSISAIAVDRFYVIMYPTKKSLDNRGATGVIILIWFFAFILASPLAIFSHLDSVHSIRYECTELSSKQFFREMKLVYSVFGMLFQYLLPLIILLTVYTKIYRRMESRIRKHSNYPKQEIASTDQATQSNLLQDSKTLSQFSSFSLLKEQKHLVEISRQRKVNILLFSIAVVFTLSWLPLNINNMAMDFQLYYYNKDMENVTSYYSATATQSTVSYTQYVTITQAVCLLLVLSSACTNPILYSWLNESFRNEFQRFFFWRKPDSQTNRIKVSRMHFNHVST
uniref:NPYR-2 n=1 Tax=Schmidtea mediterranea TaxID=79327 RepID=A0A193KUI1_SCHMD|nr:NPYR-2 [Schmidtea mediterranea]